MILEFAGERVRNHESLQEVIERKPVGSMQEVKILRKGEEVMLQVELATVEDPTAGLEKEDKKPEAEDVCER